MPAPVARLFVGIRLRSLLVLASLAALGLTLPGFAVPAAAQSITLLALPAGPTRDAWQALEEGRYRDAEPLFERALRSTPEDPSLLLGFAIVERRLARFDVADDALTRALRIDPALTPASLLLGMMLHERGNTARAIQVYEAALVRAPAHAQLTAHLERWRREAALHEGFQREEGGHFTVMFEGPSEQAAAQAAVEILEQAYGRIGDATFTYPAEPITVVLYTREQFRDVTRSPGWAGGLYDGRIRVPVGGGLGDRREFARVLSHEFVHAVVHSVAPTGVPTWINEGLAVLLEREEAVAATSEGDARAALPFADLTASFGRLSAESVKAAYQQSGSAVKWIVERVGMQALMALVADLGAGEDFERAFLARVQMSFADFQREWRGER